MAKDNKTTSKNAVNKLKNLDEGKLYAKLMAEMAKVDTKSKEAKENVYSMRDSGGNKIIYMLTEDMLRDATKTKKDIKKKWLELLVKQRLLKQLLNEAKRILENNKRFHDYGHAIEVVLNVEKLLKVEDRNRNSLGFYFIPRCFKLSRREGRQRWSKNCRTNFTDNKRLS